MWRRLLLQLSLKPLERLDQEPRTLQASHNIYAEFPSIKYKEFKILNKLTSKKVLEEYLNLNLMHYYH